MENVTKQPFSITAIYDAAVSKIPVWGMLVVVALLTAAVGYTYYGLYIEKVGYTPVMEMPEAVEPSLDLIAPPQVIPPGETPK